MAFDLHLCAPDTAMVDAWRAQFHDAAGVEITTGSILDLRGSAIVSPANSRGFMRGGIDLAYSRFFGHHLERAVQAAIAAEHGEELPVGAAVIVPTGDSRIPLLVSAPTMRTPGLRIAGTQNVHLAFRAALLAVARHNSCSSSSPIRKLLSPALGTGVGAVPLEDAARQMFAAWSEVVLQDPAWRE